jgi:hypothetical protein
MITPGRYYKRALIIVGILFASAILFFIIDRSVIKYRSGKLHQSEIIVKP